MRQLALDRSNTFSRPCFLRIAGPQGVRAATLVSPTARVGGFRIPIMIHRADQPTPAERELLSCRVVAAPRRFRDGLIEVRGPRRDLIATDSRLILRRTEPRNGAIATQWKARYASIQRFWSVFIPAGERSPSLRRVTLVVAGESFTFKVGRRDGSDLLNVLRDRAPEAVQVRGLRKHRAPDIVTSGVTVAVLAVIALGILHHHSGSSSTTVPLAVLSAGQCIAPLGQQTHCTSSDATFVVARCSDVSTIDRETVASAGAALPEIKQVIQVAARQHLCLKLAP